MNQRTWILPIIVFAQFCCTSLWFAGNGVMDDLVETFDLSSRALGLLTSSVQFGFIAGTLVFAIFAFADRFSPSKVFLISAILGGLFNLGIVWDGNQIETLLILRCLTGFFLAGIYPIGMKIAADHFDKGLGKSLGFLVGALVLGTAFPHLLKGLSDGWHWRSVLYSTSTLALLGGALMAWGVPDGPYRKASQEVDLSGFFHVFTDKAFRAAAFGYFGHMWELYAFWAFVPILLKRYVLVHPTTVFDIPLMSFLIIGGGGLACVLGGYFAERIGTKRTAFIALLLSFGCCLVSPFLFMLANDGLFIAFLFFWGMVVIADSPLFSTLVANHAPPEKKGTALTIVNCIGFTISIISIQLLTILFERVDSNSIYLLLAIGPFLGLRALWK